MAQEVEIEVQETEDERFPYIAGIKTKEHGTFYGYGKTEKEAITDAEMEMNYWGQKNE